MYYYHSFRESHSGTATLLLHLILRSDDCHEVQLDAFLPSFLDSSLSDSDNRRSCCRHRRSHDREDHFQPTVFFTAFSTVLSSRSLARGDLRRKRGGGGAGRQRRQARLLFSQSLSDQGVRLVTCGGRVPLRLRRGLAARTGVGWYGLGRGRAGGGGGMVGPMVFSWRQSQWGTD